MRLLNDATSPFGRKAMVAARPGNERRPAFVAKLEGRAAHPKAAKWYAAYQDRLRLCDTAPTRTRPTTSGE
jgi:hypothetical protein